MNDMLQHQEHYREVIERHQNEARSWARDGALSKHAAEQQAASRQVASTEERPARRSRLRRLVFHGSHTVIPAILLGILI